MGNRRDRNLGRIALGLPVVCYAVVGGAARLVAVFGLERSRWLGGIGLLACAYGAARVCIALRGWAPAFLRPARGARIAAEAAYLRRACGGAALVTGCTAGLGRAWALGLAERGCRLVLVSRDAAKLAALAAEIGGDRCRWLATDFSEGGRAAFYGDALPAALAEAGVGLVVNNVGVGTEDPLTIDELPDGAIARMTGVNCVGTAEMCRSVLPFLERRGGGAVINVGSGSGNSPTPFLSVYAATKAFVAHLSRSLDREWRGRGVRVLCAAPYYVSGTGLYASTRPSFNAPPPETVVDGALATLCCERRAAVEVTPTCAAHAAIAVLFTALAEDPVLGPPGAALANAIGVNGTMLQVMAAARSRFLAKKKTPG